MDIYSASSPRTNGFDRVAPGLNEFISSHLRAQAKAVPALRRVFEVIDGIEFVQIPRERLKVNVSNLAQVSETFSHDAYLREVSPGRYLVGVQSNVNRTKEHILHCIYHETGHAFLLAVVPESRTRHVRDAYLRTEEFITPQAESGAEENFAEAFAYYFLNRAHLARRCQVMDELLTELFEDYEDA